MKLADYLKHRGDASKLARAVGVKPQSVYRWRDGTSRPTHKGLLEKIFMATRGKVTALDFFGRAR